eukprot:6183973-Pleurochrysis_carterae.AAC.4
MSNSLARTCACSNRRGSQRARADGLPRTDGLPLRSEPVETGSTGRVRPMKPQGGRGGGHDAEEWLCAT